MPTTADQADFLTVQELARYLRVSLRTAYQLVYDGAVPSVKVASVWRIPRAELDAQLGRRSPEMRTPGLTGHEEGVRGDTRHEAYTRRAT
jgi:excisionase family DNA binding protein